ncbi:unnamed protein product [Caenorhabditis auriculariae]|uniref:Uncharacterized protein n=1 Tax=Caenorhabditis auriculariae TaxID=2777116 RepID=A0A8S1HSQ9_9PELO|nr:unnamed protein product [Caenorhabditis auriculariae]
MEWHRNGLGRRCYRQKTVASAHSFLGSASLRDRSSSRSTAPHMEAAGSRSRASEATSMTRRRQFVEGGHAFFGLL